MQKRFEYGIKNNHRSIEVKDMATFIHVTHVVKEPYEYSSKYYTIEEAEWLQEALSTALQEIAREEEEEKETYVVDERDK